MGGRIGSLVTAKPSDRRAILEEAAGISGLHARRHEAEVRLNAAENNLKRADELRKQQEKQLANLQKQAEEAGKYKMISEEIKKIEAGLYFLKLQEIDKEITLEKEINKDSDQEFENIKNSLVEIDNDLDREKSITIDANSNEKRLKEEKNDLINIDTKYYDTEKKI